MLTYHYHYHYHMGLSAIGPWPAQAMAQDIRYPWVRVGEACGPGVALLGPFEGRKSYAYHCITIPYHYGIKPLPQP